MGNFKKPVPKKPSAKIVVVHLATSETLGSIVPELMLQQPTTRKTITLVTVLHRSLLIYHR
jgi:hypothetical protein